MIEGIPRVSVLVICYNQEKVIARAMDSLLAQKDYIYEICVSDDCSKDRTWDILQEYDKKYPGLFKLNRNNPNLGIFENIEKTWEMPTGDIVSRLAGDDECGQDWFKTVVEFIQVNKIDYKNELFCIYCNYMNKYPNGDSIVSNNKMIAKGFDPMKLSIRGLISPRGACYNALILKKFVKVSQGKSHIAESAIDKQIPLFSEKSYYIPKIGNIYYSKIGVSNRIDAAIFNERDKINDYLIDFLKSQNYSLDKSDIRALKRRSPASVFENPKHTIFGIIKAVLSCYEFKYGIRTLNLHHWLFAFVRRIPHKKPIHW